MSSIATLVVAILTTRAQTQVPTADYGSLLATKFDQLFNDLTLLNKGEFGISRVPHNPFDTHLEQGQSPLQIEIRDLLDKIQGQGYLYEEGVISNIPNMTRTVDLVSSGHKASSRLAYWRWYWRSRNPLYHPFQRSMMQEEDALHATEQVLYERALTRPYRTTIGGYKIYAKPIHFNSERCLSCHKGFKRGDTAAIFVAALKRK